MSGNGVQLRRLQVTGPDVVTAELSFTPGLNVISGDSNTGKSHVLGCIDYVLGRQKFPKVSEAKGYTTVALDIVTANGVGYSLHRDIGTDVVLLYPMEGAAVAPGEPRRLKAQHEPDTTETVSASRAESSRFNK